MKNKPKIYNYKTLDNVVTRLRDDLSHNSGANAILLYAFNRTGKTRLSMSFKDRGKKKNDGKADTLYYYAFTEDLFVWNNDFEHDHNPIRYLKINEQSKFFSGFKGLSLEDRIHAHLERFAEFDFKINYDEWKVFFSREIPNPKYNSQNPHTTEPERIVQENIKPSPSNLKKRMRKSRNRVVNSMCF